MCTEVSIKQPSDSYRLGSHLVLVGEVAGIIKGILFIFNFGMMMQFTIPFIDLNVFIHEFDFAIQGIVLVLLSILVVISNHEFSIGQLHLSKSWKTILLLGILMFVLGGQIGGMMIILGSLLLRY